MFGRPHSQIFKALLSFVFVVAGAWGIVQLLALSPPERGANTVGQLPLPQVSMAPSEVAIRAGASFTTTDGRFTVHVTQVAKTTVTLTVSAKTGDVYHFNKAEIGRRLVVPAPDATYFLDLHRIRGNTIYLTMSKRQ
ncbi:hypothetical protein GCM10027430_27140 [Lysobacter tyrosinilyticus]